MLVIYKGFAHELSVVSETLLKEHYDIKQDLYLESYSEEVRTTIIKKVIDLESYSLSSNSQELMEDLEIGNKELYDILRSKHNELFRKVDIHCNVNISDTSYSEEKIKRAFSILDLIEEYRDFLRKLFNGKINGKGEKK